MTAYLLTPLFALSLLLHSAGAVTPVTVAEAAQRLDLVTLPIMKGGKLKGHRREAKLSYTVKASTKDIFAFVNKQLLDRKWEQLPGARDDGQFASADYQRDGLIVHLSVFPQGNGQPAVSLHHQGNVPLDKLPIPPGAKKTYGFTSTVMFTAAGEVKETIEAIQKLMHADGWVPYGSAGDTMYFRKNAVQVNVRVMSAPGQGGATIINFTSILLSLELPAPPFAEDPRYSDSTTVLTFDTNKTPQQVADFYRQQLASDAWRATTEKPVTIDWRQYTIFRNKAQDMLTIETHDFEGKTRVSIDHQCAAEVAEDEYLQNVLLGERATYRQGKRPTVELKMPRDRGFNQQEQWAIKIDVPKGKAYGTSDQLAQSLLSAGWITSKEPNTKAKIVRTHRLQKGENAIWLVSTEPPKRDSWVGIVGIGAMLMPIE